MVYRLGLYGAEHSNCDHMMALDFKGLMPATRDDNTKQDCLSVESRQPSECVYLFTLVWPFSLTSPWLWTNDLDTRLWARYREIYTCTSKMNLTDLIFFNVNVISRAFSALCVYSTFGHYPRPLGYLCVNFVSFAAYIAKLARGEKSRTQSITHSITQSLTHPVYLMPREPKSLFEIIL